MNSQYLIACLIYFSVFFCVSCKPVKPSDSGADAEVMALPNEYFRYKYAKKSVLYIDSAVLGKCLGSEIKKQKFNWGVDRVQYPEGSFDGYLAGSKTDHFTNHNEVALWAWVFSQPDNQITPITLFRKSLELNRNNVFASLLSIHTALRNVARWKAAYIKAHPSRTIPKDVETVNLFFNKFVDIRGDLTERGGSFRGDHPGSWYRIWGMMMKFLMSSPIGKEPVTYQNKWFGFHRDFLRVVVAGFAENIKFVLPGFADDPDKARKGEINAKAANAAYWMTMTALNHPATQKKPDCDLQDYLLTKPTKDVTY